jgi:hypothetical protein
MGFFQVDSAKPFTEGENMFNLFKKKEKQPTPVEMKNAIRDTLLGDVPIPEWPKENIDGIPWSLFVEARNHILKKQDYQAAGQLYKKITEMPGLESRHYLQAWHFLRKLKFGIPPEIDSKVFGFLMDVTLEKGTEFIAAYADHRARYFNYTGSGIVWEAPDTSLDAQIDTLLAACEVVSKQLPALTLEQGRPVIPTHRDAVQINILTAGGIRHGMGTFEGWAQTPTGGPIVAAATALMKSMVDKASSRN